MTIKKIIIKDKEFDIRLEDHKTRVYFPRVLTFEVETFFKENDIPWEYVSLRDDFKRRSMELTGMSAEDFAQSRESNVMIDGDSGCFFGGVEWEEKAIIVSQINEDDLRDIIESFLS